MSTATRIVKNTWYLYAKMCITVFISLYTTRLILASLGPSDFGIFTVVGGAIAMLGFLNSTLANATQRFMSYSIGVGDEERERRIFNISVVLHVGIALVTLVLLLVAMWPLFGGILDIDTGRVNAAKIVYLCLIFSAMLTVINVPYEAVMNAHENMLYYSIVGVFESLMKLGIAFLCVHTSKDKLIVYGVLMAIVPLITLSVMKVYCHRHYSECVLSPRKYWDGKIAGQILSFSGWNFLTAISSLFTAQGIGLVLNHFFGTLLNATQGIANQINGYMSVFSEHLMKSMNPVIVKKAGSGEISSMNKVTIAGCKYSTYLILFFSIPCMLEMPFVLKVWLKDVPDWAVLFCTLQLVQTIVVQMARAAATAVYAEGDIKGYAIWKSIMNATPVFLTYIAFKLGGDPFWSYVPMILVWGVGGDAVIIAYAHRKCQMDVMQYMKGVVLPIIGTSVIMIPLGLFSLKIMDSGFIRFIVSCIMTTLGFLAAMALFGVTKVERVELLQPIIDKIHRRG